MRLSRWLFILAVCAGPALAAGPSALSARFDPRDLAPDRNQLSNCSFEAPTEGLPPSFSLLGSIPAFSLSREQPLHGQTCLQVRVPAGATEPAVLAQLVPGCAKCTYQLAGWVRVVGDAAPPRLALEALGQNEKVLARQESGPPSGAGEGWRPLAVQLIAPAGTELMRVRVEGAPGAAGEVDALHLAITAGPRRRVYGPRANDLHLTRTEPTWVMVQWAGRVGQYEISYRHPKWPRARRVAYDRVPGFAYSLVGLQPETTYQVRLRLMWPEFYDAEGAVVPAPVLPGDSEPLAFTTPPSAYREAGQLRIWPMTPLAPADAYGHNPRLEAGKDCLYLAHELAGGIALAKLTPEPTLKASRKEVVPAPPAGPPLRLLDLRLLAQTLYVLYERGPNDVALLPFRTETEQADPEVTLPLGAPPSRLVSASLAAFRNDLWVQWVEETGKGDSTRGLLRAAPITNGKLDPKDIHAWTKAWVAYPGEASLAAFGDELMIPFSDAPLYQTLRVVSFDGLSFGGLRKLRDMGRNGEARGIQLGPNFYLIFTSDASYLGQQGRCRDVMLATLPPGRMGLEMVNLLDDQKYNCAPGIAALGESLWTVHEKLEQAPTAQAPQPRSFGLYLGRIDFGPVRRDVPQAPRGRGARPLITPVPLPPAP